MRLPLAAAMAGVNYRQDMPPKGGYQAFKYSRNLQSRGPNGTVIMLGGVALMAFGFYVIKKTNEERRYRERAATASSTLIMPGLVEIGAIPRL